MDSPIRACPFCGERLKLKVVKKHMRRDGDFAPGAYMYCMKCRCRGPLAIGDYDVVEGLASAMWNGKFGIDNEVAELPLFGECK